MSFARMTTVSCSTKRNPAPVGNKVGAAVTYLTGLLCTPLDPLDPELQDLSLVGSPHEALQTFLQGNPDIVEGDILVVSSTDYYVRSVADWVWRTDTFRHLIIEQVK